MRSGLTKRMNYGKKKMDAEVEQTAQVKANEESNGKVEAVTWRMQGQFRKVKSALESRLGVELAADHNTLPWVVGHTVLVGK